MAGNIKGITIELNGDTTKLDKALRNVNKETRETQKQLSEVERALKMDPGNTDLIKQKQRLLGEEIGSTKQKLAMLKEADKQVSEDMKNGVEGSAEKHQELQRQIAVTEAKEKSLQKELDKMNETPSKIDQVTASFEKAGGKLQAVGEKATKAGTALTKGVTVPIAAIGAGSMKAFQEVDAGLDIVVKKTGASGKALEGMQDTVKNIASRVPSDFETIGSAVGEVNTRFGVTGSKLEGLSEQFVKFAELNDMDVSNAIDSTQKALAAFGMDADDAGTLLDQLNVVGQNTGASMDTLLSGLVQNGTAFQELGLSAEQAATLMGQMETSGANSETVMQGLRKALKNATKEGIPLDQALRDLQTSILEGTDGMDGLTYAYDLFGKSGDQIYGAIKNGTLDFTALGGAAADAGGSVSETFENTLSPLEKFQMTMNSLKVVGYDIASSLGEVL